MMSLADYGEEMEDFAEGEMSDLIARAIAGIESDEELESEDEAPVPKVLTPHPKKIKGAEAKKEVPQLSFDSGDDDSDDEEMEVDEVPKKEVKKAPVKAANGTQNAIVAEENFRRELRDKKSLFLKGFPRYVKDKELKQLHSDIVSVRHFANRSVAWIEFATEEKCDAAHDALQGVKVRGEAVTVDFCGSKSKHPTARDERISNFVINPLQLMVSNVPGECTDKQIKMVFPEAVNVVFRKKEGTAAKCALVSFSDEASCREGFDKGRNMTIGGVPVEVLYGRTQVGKSDLKRPAPADDNAGPAKKARQEVPKAIAAKTTPKAIAAKTTPKAKQALKESPKPVVKLTPKAVEKPKQASKETPKVVEKPKQVAKQTPKVVEKPKETPKQTPKAVEKPKETSKLASKQTPKAKQAPKESPKPVVKQTLKAAEKHKQTSKETPKQTPKAKFAAKESPKQTPKQMPKQTPKKTPKNTPKRR
ncbi:hypothetical protein L596_011781 [Steinernema carpocapsae]|uniref:RRM domain-containing protein n=1 Tax=Steinernema carpocapsae TaxID=34508 RepID=A0A4V6A4M5_STECR|nr:hypothetical protein L596_011781 [Steinernema carpocapsae]